MANYPRASYMLFKTYNSEVVARVFFNGYFFGSVFLGLVSLYGFISDAGVLSTLSGFMYLWVVSLLSLNNRFRKNSFSILLCVFTLLYLNIPVAFILFEGSDYVFGEGLASTPFAQSDYQQAPSFGFLYLTILWVAMWLGIISAGSNIKKIEKARFAPIGTKPILLLGLIVLAVTWIDNQAFADVRLEGAEKLTSFLAFVFFDHAYLVMSGLIMFFKLNEPSYFFRPRARKITSLLFMLFITFTALNFLAGSKGAILVIFILLIVLPFCFFGAHPRTTVSFPSIKFIAMLVFLAPVLFYFALIQRISLASGIAPDLSSLLAGLSEFDTSLVYDITKQIFYRLSWGGIDRFLLIVQSFSIDSLDSETTREFVSYISKNTLNLLLPGTPFPEAYAPSSQLYSQVIHKNLVSGEIDTNALIFSFNTQPYTIFGVFVIIFGFMSPIFIYVFSFAYIYIFNKIDSVFIKITMLYFFMGALSSYGIEAALGNSVHLFVSILLMYFLIKVFSQFRIISPAPTYHTRSYKPTDYPLKNQDDYRRNSYPQSSK